MADEKNMGRTAIAAGVGLLLFGIWFAWGRTPQIGGDKESVKVVDAALHRGHVPQYDAIGAVRRATAHPEG